MQTHKMGEDWRWEKHEDKRTNRMQQKNRIYGIPERKKTQRTNDRGLVSPLTRMGDFVRIRNYCN